MKRQCTSASRKTEGIVLFVMCDDSGPEDKLQEFIGDVKTRYPDCIVDCGIDDSNAVAEQLEKLKKLNHKCAEEGKPVQCKGLLINHIADFPEDALHHDEADCYMVLVEYVARKGFKDEDEDTDEEYAEMEEDIKKCPGCMGFCGIHKNQTIPQFVDELFGAQKV